MTTIAFPNVKDYAGKTIQVTYKGVVTLDAVDQVTNTATVKNTTTRPAKVRLSSRSWQVRLHQDRCAATTPRAWPVPSSRFPPMAARPHQFSQDANGVYYPDATNGNEILTSASRRQGSTEDPR